MICAPLQAARPSAQSADAPAYACFGVKTASPPAVSRPACQPPPYAAPDLSRPSRDVSSTRPNQLTVAIVGSQAKYFSVAVFTYCVCCDSLTVETFSSWKYCVYFCVSVCQPTSSTTSWSPSTVVGWPVPPNASYTACLTRSRLGMPKKSGFAYPTSGP